MAIVIIGVGLAGVLAAFNTTVKSSADPMIRKQMLALAEQMLEEVLLKPYQAGSFTISKKICIASDNDSADCSRENADDIFDYHGYSSTPPRDPPGNRISLPNTYTVSVQLSDASSLLGTGSNDAQAITVMVTASGSAESISLTGYRSDYAK